MPILAAAGILLLLALVFGPSWWIKHVMRRHGIDRPDLAGTGGEFARHLLDEAKLSDVKVETTDLGDHYDPIERVVRLLPQHHDGRSVAAVAVAAHEVSHAIQHARSEPAFMRRMDLVGKLIWVERLAMGVLILAPVLAIVVKSPAIMVLNIAAAIGLLGIHVAVHVVTLPVEFDASFRKALPVLEGRRYLSEQDMRGGAQRLEGGGLYLRGGRACDLAERGALDPIFPLLSSEETMPDHYDVLETRDPATREREQFARLPETIARAMSAPGWAKQLAGIDPQSVTSRAALATLPLLRKPDLLAKQRENPPFGGFNLTPPGKAKRLHMSPGPIFEPEGHGKDFAGAARALFAAGFRAGDIVHNAFSYHLTPGAYILEAGAHALGCAVIPGGVGNTEQQLEAIAHFKPAGYVGTPDFLKILLDTAGKAGKDASSIRRGLVSGAALPASLRAELSERGVAVLQCYAIADAGVISYESEAREGMIVNETMIVEIVRPGTGDPVPAGEVGEAVITSFNPDYPMIRLATGDLSAVLPGISPCGRTNMRIKGWMGRADQTTKVKGMFVRPELVIEVGKRHAGLGRVRLVVTRDGEQDAMTLQAECSAPQPGLAEAVAATLQSVTKLKGEVKFVAAGALPNDGKVIADERPVG